uniref:Uncharacterized protein LOC111129143 isoform X1 n=1 Tax=Crassostrea virginica TaxID=6565 RepID=A0A8B8DTZ7_CRAVI|nr:uncharacterized protein LOC111129143 isoform X1 [Crassostrea virginica]
MFRWASGIKGVPKKMKWPVKYLGKNNQLAGMVDVYCRSDNAIFTLKKEEVEPLESNMKWEEKAQSCLAKKKETLKCFLSDLEWAKEGQCKRRKNSGKPKPKKRKLNDHESKPVSQLLDDGDENNNLEEEVKQRDDPYPEVFMDPGEETQKGQKDVPFKQLLDDDGDENVEEEVKQKDDPYPEVFMDPGEETQKGQKDVPFKQLLDDVGDENVEEEVKQKDDPYPEVFMDPREETQKGQKDVPFKQLLDDDGDENVEEEVKQKDDPYPEVFMDPREETQKGQKDVPFKQLLDDVGDENVEEEVKQKDDPYPEVFMDPREETQKGQKDVPFKQLLDDDGDENVEEEVKQKDDPYPEVFMDPGEETQKGQKDVPFKQLLDDDGDENVEEEVKQKDDPYPEVFMDPGEETQKGQKDVPFKQLLDDVGDENVEEEVKQKDDPYPEVFMDPGEETQKGQKDVPFKQLLDDVVDENVEEEVKQKDDPYPEVFMDPEEETQKGQKDVPFKQLLDDDGDENVEEEVKQKDDPYPEVFMDPGEETQKGQKDVPFKQLLDDDGDENVEEEVKQKDDPYPEVFMDPGEETQKGQKDVPFKQLLDDVGDENVEEEVKQKDDPYPEVFMDPGEETQKGQKDVPFKQLLDDDGDENVEEEVKQKDDPYPEVFMDPGEETQKGQKDVPFKQLLDDVGDENVEEEVKQKDDPYPEVFMDPGEETQKGQKDVPFKQLLDDDGDENVEEEVKQKDDPYPEVFMDPGEETQKGQKDVPFKQLLDDDGDENVEEEVKQKDDPYPEVFMDPGEETQKGQKDDSFNQLLNEYEVIDDFDDDKDEDYIPTSEPTSEDDDDEEGYLSDLIDVLDNNKWKLTVENVLNEISDFEEIDETSKENEDTVTIEIEDIQKKKTLPENIPGPCSIESVSENLFDRPEERKLCTADCIFDEDFPNVYIKKYQTGNEKSKNGRLYDRVCACLFCHKLLTNIQTHLMNKHAHEEKVMEISKLKNLKKTSQNNKEELDKELKQKLALLRNKGNDLHNKKVLHWKKGELLVPRRNGKDKKLHVQNYIPCPNCEEWIVLSSVTNHQIACPASSSRTDFHKGSYMLTVSVLTGRITLKGSKTLRREVIPCMKRDSTAEVALHDDLIVGLGDVWLMKNVDNKRKRKYYSSFHMRLVSRLLQELRKKKDQPLWSFQEALAPANFDLFVESALACGYSDSSQLEDDELHHPSTPIKIGFDITRLAGLKLALSIKMSDEVGRKEATDFLQLLKMEWSTRVNRISRATLAERNFNRRKPLPDPEDIVKLASYLVTELQKLENDLDPVLADGVKFRRVVMLVQSRLLLYNRRRPGELEALSLEYYRRRSTSLTDSDMSLRQQLTSLERKMLETQELVEIRGKNGTRVPVIIPREAVPAMEFLANDITRKKVGIREDNIYLFANSALDVVRAADSLQDTKSHCDLKYPERVHSTNLRKHCATIAQVIGLKDHEMTWLCRHLGHTRKVHEQYYRTTSGLIERLDVAKLMLLQEGNMHGKFQGKSLKDITFEEILSKEDPCNEKVQADQAVEDMTVDEMAVDDMAVDDVAVDDFEFEDVLGGRKRPKKTDRVRWTKKEEEEIKEYFSLYFNGKIKKKCPSREHCNIAIQQSKENSGEICRRKWDTLKKKVSNMLIKCSE